MKNKTKLIKVGSIILSIFLTYVSYSRLHFSYLIFGFVILTTLVLINYILNNSKKNLTILTLFYLCFASVLVINYRDKYLFAIGGFEKDQLQKRESYYARVAGRVYQNKIGNIYLNSKKVYLDKLVRKESSIFQSNMYFSSKNDSSYPLVFVPFFAFGILVLLSKCRKFLLTYLIISSIIVVFMESGKAIFIFLPLMNLAILLSYIEIINFKKN